MPVARLKPCFCISVCHCSQAVTRFRCTVAAFIRDGLGIEPLLTALEKVDKRLPKDGRPTGLTKEEEDIFVRTVDQGIAICMDRFCALLLCR